MTKLVGGYSEHARNVWENNTPEDIGPGVETERSPRSFVLLGNNALELYHIMTMNLYSIIDSSERVGFAISEMTWRLRRLKVGRCRRAMHGLMYV